MFDRYRRPSAGIRKHQRSPSQPLQPINWIITWRCSWS